MALINDMQQLCAALTKRGWSEVLARHGLNLQASNLASELRRPLSIDRGQPGFEEFAAAGKRAIEPGQPALSLLYHALASAGMDPIWQGQMAHLWQDCPTVDELDLVENYIYAVTHRTWQAFQRPAIAVFAYQYCPQALSPHQQHADLVFSHFRSTLMPTEEMTCPGGAEAAEPASSAPLGSLGLPVRYGAFIAETRPAVVKDARGRVIPEIDRGMRRLFPVHKLFPGPECLMGGTTARSLASFEFHMANKRWRIYPEATYAAGLAACTIPGKTRLRRFPVLV